MTEQMEGKYRNLLLCTDGSEYSEGAIREGLKLAKLFRAGLTVLFVIEFNAEFETLAPDLVEKMEADAGNHLRSIKARADKESLTCRTFITRSENPFLQITKEASEINADLIIMGRRGRTGLKRLLMGSVTKRVIGHADCNILVVPRSADIKFRNLLIPTDGSKFSNAAAVEAVDITKRCGSRLIAVSVVPSESMSPFDIVHTQMQHGLVAEKEMKAAEASINMVKELAEKEGVNTERLIFAGRPSDAVVTIAKEKIIDLIIMGSHGRTGLQGLLMGSVAERVVGLAECATLVVKIRE